MIDGKQKFHNAKYKEEKQLKVIDLLLKDNSNIKIYDLHDKKFYEDNKRNDYLNAYDLMKLHLLNTEVVRYERDSEDVLVVFI